MDLYVLIGSALSVIFFIVAIGLYFLARWIRQGQYTKNTTITNKVVIITGANTGIGKATAIDLAKRGGKVYLACRDKTRGENALKEIRQKSGSDRVYFLQLNLANLASIREFSQKFHQLESKLDILVNNAGIMACPRMTTDDGFETQIGVNHLGHFLLTNLLLDLLKAAAPSRIVVVSSGNHKLGKIHKDNFMLEKDYAEWKSYNQSKLANNLFTLKLSKDLKQANVTANVCSPGPVLTELQRYMNSIIVFFMHNVFFWLMKTPEEGAQTQIRLAVDPELQNVTGKYFNDCKEEEPAKAALDEEVAEWLWQKSAELVKL